MDDSTPQEQVYGNTGYVVLDRNLGAFMTGEGDNWKANGVYFQWGRPIPIGWSAKANGSPIATEATSVRFSIEHPTVQLCTNNVENTKSDWYLGAWTGARTDRNDAFGAIQMMGTLILTHRMGISLFMILVLRGIE